MAKMEKGKIEAKKPASTTGKATRERKQYWEPNTAETFRGYAKMPPATNTKKKTTATTKKGKSY